MNDEQATLTQEDFIRIVLFGPVGLREIFWVYLFQWGLISVPWSWQWALLCTRFGLALLPLIDRASGALFRILKLRS